MRNDYAGLCGITEEELEHNFSPEIEVLSQKEGLDRNGTLAALKQWYDGYLFAKEGESVYNPFSILSAFKAQDFGSYRFATGTPTFLVNFLKEARYSIPDLDGNIQLNEAGLETYWADAQSSLPILFQSGYFTIKKYDAKYRLYSLGFPNDEMRYGFLNNLLPVYTNITEQATGFFYCPIYQRYRSGKCRRLYETDAVDYFLYSV